MSARGLRIGIYAPYLHICGGGEKFVGMIAALLSRDRRVEFIVTDGVDLGRVQARMPSATGSSTAPNLTG
jgi:hypothetical protein